VGDLSAPLGAGDIFTLDVHRSNGECTGALALPADAVGVALNVTAVNATASSNIRIYPANLTDVPLLSNLNVTAGAPPTPNKVDVKLSPSGEIKVYNFNGSVNIILDVVGYYTNSTLQELSQRVIALEVAQPFAVTARDESESVTPANEAVVSVTVTAPVAGQVTVDSTTNADEGSADGRVRCSLIAQNSVMPNALDFDYLQRWESPGTAGEFSQMAGTRTFDIAAGATVTYSLVCDHDGSSDASDLSNSVLTAIFTPAP
jgi:hypothetical protein